MEYIIYYLQNSFVFATIGIGILLMPTEKYYKDDKHALYIKIAVSLFLLLSIFTTMEHFAELLPERNVWRFISTSAGYIIRPAIIFFIGIGIKKLHKNIWLLAAPLLLNALLVIISCFTGIIFTFNESNHWLGGPIRFFPHIISFAYVGYILVAVALTIRGRSAKEILPILVVATCGVIATILEVADVISGVVDGVLAIGCLFDLLYLTVYYSQRDSLTGLLNHRVYYSDAMKYNSSLTAVVSIDMNGLKVLNDNYGHEAGDRGLIVLANCLLKESNMKMKVYRVGGDEFGALCFNMSDLEVRQAIERLYDYVSHTEYTCAIGYYYRKENESFSEMFHNADMSMYDAKRIYYSEHDRRDEKKK